MNNKTEKNPTIFGASTKNSTEIYGIKMLK